MGLVTSDPKVDNLCVALPDFQKCGTQLVPDTWPHPRMPRPKKGLEVGEGKSLEALSPRQREWQDPPERILQVTRELVTTQATQAGLESPRKEGES